jgi:hypothetical protein
MLEDMVSYRVNGNVSKEASTYHFLVFTSQLIISSSHQSEAKRSRIFFWKNYRVDFENIEKGNKTHQKMDGCRCHRSDSEEMLRRAGTSYAVDFMIEHLWIKT